MCEITWFSIIFVVGFGVERGFRRLRHSQSRCFTGQSPNGRKSQLPKGVMRMSVRHMQETTIAIFSAIRDMAQKTVRTALIYSVGRRP